MYTSLPMLEGGGWNILRRDFIQVLQKFYLKLKLFRLEENMKKYTQVIQDNGKFKPF